MTSNSQSSILIVEDDEGTAMLERRALERRGFVVVDVATGDEAVKAVTGGTVDLIVMDYRLPDLTTGLDLLNRLKSLGHDLPVIMVTGFSDEATAIHALREGVRDFVPKTTQFLDYLPEAVERVLKAVRTERQLSESELRFKSFMDNSPAIAFVKDADGRLLYANRRFAEECGVSEWLNRTDAELWPEATASQIREHDLALLATKGPLQVLETLTTRDGTVHHWLTCRFPLADGKGGMLVGGMAVDVTLQRSAEQELRIRDQQLQQAQKMEAIGQLAGGVAHDFNNLLTIILGYSSILATAETDGEALPDRPEMLHEINHAAERAAHLTRQLLAFSRKQILAPQVVDLNTTVTEMQKMLRRLIGEDIAMHLNLCPDLESVSADPGQLEQIIMNLVVNARDAMPQGGDLCIETANVELDASYAQAHAEVKAGRYVMLVLTDSGCGMDAATKAHIFEPFFTTKEQGKGTGLGLATVYGIVRQSGGHIFVYSEPGQGTSFKIYLPVVVQTVSIHDQKSGRSPKLKGCETILLVEDDDAVRSLGRSILEMYGYTVLDASDPTAAIALSQSHQGTIDVLLTDVVMPHLNGKRLSELLLPDRPEMKVLFMSGYTDDAIVRQGILDRGIHFLQKPFTPVTLAGRVRDVLDGNKVGS